MFNFWDEYNKQLQQKINIYACLTIIYVLIRVMNARLGYEEPTKDIFGSWGIEQFALCSLSFILLGPALGAYLKKKNWQ